MCNNELCIKKENTAAGKTGVATLLEENCLCLDNGNFCLKFNIKQKVKRQTTELVEVGLKIQKKVVKSSILPTALSLQGGTGLRFGDIHMVKPAIAACTCSQNDDGTLINTLIN